MLFMDAVDWMFHMLPKSFISIFKTVASGIQFWYWQISLSAINENCSMQSLVRWLHISQNHKRIEVGRGLWRLSDPTPLAQAGPPRVGCSGPHPDSFWASPRMKTSQRAWATCASTWSSSQWKNCFLILRGSS